MTLRSSNDPRGEFHFVAEVRKHFRFLESLGFRESESSATHVCYSRADVVIEIYHGRQSYEIGLNLIRQGTSYSLEQMLEVHKRVGGKISFQPFAATDRTGVVAGLNRLARMFASCSNYFLTGDAAAYRSLDEYAEEARARLATDVLEYQLRPKAEAAFRDQDYRLAAELYGQMGDRLSPAEVAKLNFARSHS